MAEALVQSLGSGIGKSQDLGGVGDGAFVLTVGNTAGQMEILKGSTILTVNVQGDPSLQNITPLR